MRMYTQVLPPPINFQGPTPEMIKRRAIAEKKEYYTSIKSVPLLLYLGYKDPVLFMFYLLAGIDIVHPVIYYALAIIYYYKM